MEHPHDGQTSEEGERDRENEAQRPEEPETPAEEIAVALVELAMDRAPEEIIQMLYPVLDPAIRHPDHSHLDDLTTLDEASEWIDNNADGMHPALYKRVLKAMLPNLRTAAELLGGATLLPVCRAIEEL